MTTYELVKIADPKKAGDYSLIRAIDFDPAKHVLFVDGEASASPASKSAAPISTPKRGRKAKG